VYYLPGYIIILTNNYKKDIDSYIITIINKLIKIFEE